MDYKEKIIALLNDKELSQEQKEKLEEVFPELKESEDEKVRKALVEMVHDTTGDELWIDYNVHKEEALAWLEKQGEVVSDKDGIEAEEKDIRKAFNKIEDEKQDKQKSQRMISAEAKEAMYDKSADKVEPKFKVGDWVAYHRNDSSREIIQVYDIRDDRYYFTDNVHFSWSVKECDEKSHLWTIQDAKDGDILVCGKEKRPFIFKGLLDKFHPNNPVVYCGINCGNEFCIPVGISWWTDEEIEPATKEQCDLLFQKMKEAGYEWDAENKELKKIEQKSWSEEDEKMLVDAYVMLDWYKGNNWWTARRIKDWLNSLKERIGG